MKSTLFALLPLAGFALAESACPVEQQTVTSTKYDYETLTVTPTADKQQATPDAATCSRRTVTTTEVERVTVTVAPSGQMPAETIDVTSTSTKYIETTITIRPSGKAPAASAIRSSMQWGNYPNATHQSSTTLVMSTSQLPAFSSTAPAPAMLTSELPSFSIVGQAVAPTKIPTSEAKAPSTPSPAPEAAKDIGTTAAKTGEATFYGGNTAGGMCSFTGYTLPSNLFGTALSDSDWASAEACGQCVSVTGPSGAKITAMITDQCPGCGPHHLDLYPDAFKKLADPSKGIIKVSWDFVPCGITTPIVLKNKSGTSKFWFSMQVMNANVGVKKLEVSTDGGNTWKATSRQPYNFFENSAGFGTDSVDVKVTSVDGKTVVVKGVSIASNSLKTAGGNF